MAFPSPFVLEKNYCPKVEHCVSTLGVCERRSMKVMAEIWPKCAGCDFREVLVKKPAGKGQITMSDPPIHWWNMDRYIAALGDDVCKKHRMGI